MTTLSARARIERLIDAGSFHERFAASTPSVATGIATVAGRLVAVLAHDAGAAPAWGPLAVEKTLRLQEDAERLQCPIVYLYDASPPHGKNGRLLFGDRDGVGRTYYNCARLSGRVPQVAVLFGRVNSVKSFPAALCDVLVMVEGSTLSLSAPDLAARMTGRPTSDADIDAGAHATITGIADAVARDDAEAIDWVRRYLGHMPQHAREPTPLAPPAAPLASGSLAELIPRNPARPFPMRAFIDGVVDRDSVLELKERFAGELITAHARIEGHAVAIVANNSATRGGVLHAESCDKAVRFIQSSDAFNLPLLYLVDVPGFMAGAQSERSGIVRQAAKLFMANATATVPKLSVVVRKVHSAGLFAMCGPAFSPDVFFALPDSEVSVVGKKFVDMAIRDDAVLPTLRGRERELYEAELRLNCLTHTDPRLLARDLVIDAVVPPGELRARLAVELRRLRVARPVSNGDGARRIWPF